MRFPVQEPCFLGCRVWFLVCFAAVLARSFSAFTCDTLHSTLHTLHFILHTPYLTLYARHSAFYTSLHSTLHTGAAAVCVPMRHSFSYRGSRPIRRPPHSNPSLCWCFHVFGGPGGKKDFWPFLSNVLTIFCCAREAKTFTVCLSFLHVETTSCNRVKTA